MNQRLLGVVLMVYIVAVFSVLFIYHL